MLLLSMAFVSFVAAQALAAEEASPVEKTEKAMEKVMEASQDTIVTGTVTEEGNFLGNCGKNYLLTGDKAEEVLNQQGKMFEIKGTVAEKEGNWSLEVKQFQILEEETEKIPAEKIPAEIEE